MMEAVEVDAEPEVEKQVDGEQYSQTDAPAPSSRRRTCCRRLGSVFCSPVGTAVMLAAYSVMGGFLFRAVELPAEVERRGKAERLRDDHLENVWKLGYSTWTELLSAASEDGSGTTQLLLQQQQQQQQRWGKANFTDALRELLRRYYFQMGEQPEGGKWEAGFDSDDDKLRWSIVSSILYSITILTTVGYGHVTPRTTWGKVLTVVYGILGIPLMVLYLVKMGALFADGFRLFYQKVCCDLCCCKRCERARRRRRRGTVVLHRARTGAAAAATADAYLYGAVAAGAAVSGAKASAPTGSDPTEAGSDVTMTTTATTTRADRSRPGFVTSAAPLGVGGGGGGHVTLHGSLPRSGNRNWKTTPSSHVYETISLVDDVVVGACHVTTRGRQRWSGGQPRPTSDVAAAAPLRGAAPHQWRNAWVPTTEPLIFAQDRFLLGPAERERERERGRQRRRSSRGVESSRDAGVERGAAEWRSPPERKYSSLPRQASSLYARSERRSSRVVGPEMTTKDRKQQLQQLQFPPERVEAAKAARNGRWNDSADLLRRASINAVGSGGGAGAPARTAPPAAEEGYQGGAASKNQRTKKKKKTTTTKRGEKIGEPRVGPRVGQSLPSHLGQSDESFVTAPGDSSADPPPTTDEEEGDEDLVPAPAPTAVTSTSSSSRKRRKTSATAAAATTTRRKTPKQEPEAMQLMPMTSTSVEDSELAQELGNKPASTSNTVSDGVCPYGGGGGGGDGGRPGGKRRVPIGACLLVLLAYVFTGTLAFCLWEGWDHVTGAYFCFVSLGTIGFGDFVPGSGSGSTEKLAVLVLWLVLGLTLVAMCLTLTAENFDRKSSSSAASSGGQHS